MQKLAFSYVRFSSEKQKHGVSVARQSELAEKWCAANNAVLDATLNMKDLGTSGFDGSNLKEDAALGSFIEAAKKGTVPKGSYLLVENFDRLSRLPIDEAYDLFRRIVKLGIFLVTLNDNKIYDEKSLGNFSDVIITLVVMQRAFEESVTKSNRLIDRWNRRRSNLATRKIATKYPSWLKLSKDYSAFTLKEPAVTIIKKIFELYVNGTGVVKIASQFNQAGTPSIAPGGGIWKTHYIQQILRNRALLGEFQPHRRGADGKKEIAGVMHPEYFPGVIDNELFDKVQFMLGKVPRGTAKGQEYGVNIFAKKLFCPYCMEKMFIAYPNITKRLADGSVKRYKGARVVTCLSAKNGKCINIGWPLKDLESKFLACSDELKAMFSTRQKDSATLLEEITITQSKIVLKQKAVANLRRMVEIAGDDEAFEAPAIAWKETEVELKTLDAELKQKLVEVEAGKAANPYTNLKDIDLTDPLKRASLCNAINHTISKIYVFFAGNKFNHANAICTAKRLIKDGENPVRRAYTIRKKHEIEKRRFFVVHLKSVGKDKRLVYPRFEVAMGDFEDYDTAVGDAIDASAVET